MDRDYITELRTSTSLTKLGLGLYGAGVLLASMTVSVPIICVSAALTAASGYAMASYSRRHTFNTEIDRTTDEHAIKKNWKEYLLAGEGVTANLGRVCTALSLPLLATAPHAIDPRSMAVGVVGGVFALVAGETARASSFRLAHSRAAYQARTNSQPMEVLKDTRTITPSPS